MAQQLKGTGVALVTPYKEDGKIDFEALENLIEYVIRGSVDFLVVMGTTGEAPTLSMDERQELINEVLRISARRLPVVCGIGGNSTADVIHQLDTLDLHGIHSVLSVAPYYNKPSQSGLYGHFKAIAQATRMPIILYNVPGRTASNLLPETVVKLATECRNIIGIKEASGNIPQCTELMRTKPDGFFVLSGDDNLILSQMVLGMDGIISVAANMYPQEMTEIINHAIVGKFDKARKFFFNLLPAIDLMFVEGNPGGIKCFLSVAGLCANTFRLPLSPVSDATHQKIKTLLGK
jgi:4-hydroxy-tetrahydrodipicolinate synthase